MTFAAGYSLDLYCDNADNIDGSRPSFPGYGAGSGNDGLHGFRQFPVEFHGETWGDTAGQARALGWRINRRARTAFCPKCSGKAPSPPPGGTT
jgi:hypothetical protein